LAAATVFRVMLYVFVVGVATELVFSGVGGGALLGVVCGARGDQSLT